MAFLAVRKNTNNYWIETDGDVVAQELIASEGENPAVAKKQYWHIMKILNGATILKPVTLSPKVSRTVDRREIKVGGEVLGGADL